MQPSYLFYLEQISGIFKEESSKIYCIYWSNIEQDEKRLPILTRRIQGLSHLTRVISIDFIRV